MKKTRNILLAFRLAYSSNRNYLKGIARYLAHAKDWRVSIPEQFYDFSAKDLSGALRDEYDGIITVVPHDPSVAAALDRLGLPIVVLGSTRDDLPLMKRNTTLIRADDTQIGELAARHFLSLGQFRSYAFIASNPSTSWSDLRYRSFARILAQHSCKVVFVKSSFPAGSLKDIAFIREQLAKLPKPAAVFVAFDQRATQTLQACEDGGLAVPKDVQLIGVDNDPIFCDFSRPTLTSIATNQVRQGEVAAIELERLFRRKTSGRKSIVLRNAEIIERESTSSTSPATALVERALDYISKHATDGIAPRDVIAYLHVSPALVNKRFREVVGKTLGKTIAETRLKAVRSKLRTSNQKIEAITRSCGFTNSDQAKRLFRRAFGQTMRDYRKGLTVSEIVCACGYTNPDTFRNAFKASTGVTPNEWRKS